MLPIPCTLPGERALLITLARRSGSHRQYRDILSHYPDIRTGAIDNFESLRGTTTLDTLRRKLQDIPWSVSPADDYPTLTLLDPEYPAVWRELTEPPLVVWYEGDLKLLPVPSISVVGARKITPHTRRYLRHLIPGLVGSGLVTVSGLAYGVDATVHAETLHAGGRTIGVLGNSLDERSFNPKSVYRLSRELLEQGGLIISEYPSPTTGARWTFPRRNRLVAALSPVTLVAQATSQSGSLITAQWATKLGRTVVTPSVDYFEPSLAGNREIIAEGARVSVGLEDILTHYQAAGVTITGPSEHATELDLEGLCAHFDFSPTDSLARITTLELTGEIQSVGVGLWSVNA